MMVDGVFGSARHIEECLEELMRHSARFVLQRVHEDKVSTDDRTTRQRRARRHSSSQALATRRKMVVRAKTPLAAEATSPTRPDATRRRGPSGSSSQRSTTSTGRQCRGFSSVVTDSQNFADSPPARPTPKQRMPRSPSSLMPITTCTVRLVTVPLRILIGIRPTTGPDRRCLPVSIATCSCRRRSRR